MADIVTQEKSNLINDLAKKKRRPSQFCGTDAGILGHTQKLIVGHKELLDFKTK